MPDASLHVREGWASGAVAALQRGNRGLPGSGARQVLSGYCARGLGQPGYRSGARCVLTAQTLALQAGWMGGAIQHELRRNCSRLHLGLTDPAYAVLHDTAVGEHLSP